MKKFLSALCLLAIMTSLFASCGSSGTGSNPEDVATGDGKKLTISFLEAGYGRVYMEQWAETFKEKKKAQGEDITIELKGDPAYGIVATTLPAGPKVNDVDLYFTSQVNVTDILSVGDKYVDGYSVALADLSDVYNRESDIAGKTIAQKMNPQYLDFNTYDGGKQFSMSWGSDPCGIVANIAVLDKVFGSGKYTLPRTTDELHKMSEDVTKSGKAKGISYPGQVGYWKYALSVWWAQYQGIEDYNKFFTGKAFDEDLDKYIYSPEIFNQTGMLKSLSVLEKLISKPENLVSGCNSTYFTTLQTQFLQGDAAFMPNGGWLEHEMKDFKNPGIVMMKTPVVSSIIEKTSTITNDVTLAAVIDYIDGKASASPAGVSEADINTVKNARNIIWDTGFDFGAVVPAYADARNLAKEFLAYVATDEAIEIFYNNTGAYMPFDFDYTKASGFENASTFSKSKQELMGINVTKISQSSKSLLFSKNSLSPFLGVIPEIILGATNPSDKKTAKEFFEDNYKQAKKEWSNYLAVAGIST